jgi:hypothetical protein
MPHDNSACKLTDSCMRSHSKGLDVSGQAKYRGTEAAIKRLRGVRYPRLELNQRPTA